MNRKSVLLKFATASILPITFYSFPLLSAAQTPEGVPHFVARASDRGALDSSKQLNVTIWLQLHNKADLDNEVKKMYEPGSPTYHHWMDIKDLAKYAPTSAEVEQVKKELTSHSLSVDEIETNHLAIRVHGTVSNVQEAFQTQIHEFGYNGKVRYANTAAPHLTGTADTFVSAVTGLTDTGVRSYAVPQVNPRTGKSTATPLAANPQGIVYASQCFYRPREVTFTTVGASLPVGVFYGNSYGADPTNTKTGTLAPCGYSAAQVQTAYGLPAAYKEKLDGTGETIVIIDPYGSTNIMKDANTYSTMNHLPQLTSKNFQVIYPEGKPFIPSQSWVVETSLDVELAHAMAPGAKIDLLVPSTSQDEDLQAMLLYAITHKLGSVISNSYGYPEVESGPATLNAYNEVIELGAAAGISVNFASGDSGDFGSSIGLASVSTPGDSPYATSVGGTSVGLPTTNGGNGQTGWGNNLTYLSEGTTFALDPPVGSGNYGGAGGGESIFFPKPAYQKSLPGTKRQQPDVSALADPFTGVEIVYSVTADGVHYTQLTEVIGGTSAASPIFSGIWAIANQKAGRWLGQAAPLIATLPSSDITDIVPVTSPTNVAGTVFDTAGSTFYSASTLAEPLENQRQFFSSIFDLGQGIDVVLTFGTDTSLTVTPGWDNVTGYGTPNGMKFINAVAAAK